MFTPSAVRSWFKYLNEGDELMFEVESTEKGPAAVKLQKDLILNFPNQQLWDKGFSSSPVNYLLKRHNYFLHRL